MVAKDAKSVLVGRENICKVCVSSGAEFLSKEKKNERGWASNNKNKGETKR